MFLFWLNLRAGIKDLFCNTGSAILTFFVGVGKLVRHLLYIVLSVAYGLGMFAFLASFYYIYKCYCEYQKGVWFTEMVNLPYALCLFFIPIGIAILREIVKPD